MTRIAVSAEFVRPGQVGGTEQALHYTVDGLLQNLRPDDELLVIGGLPIPPHSQLTVTVPPRPARLRFVQETFTYRALAAKVDAYFLPNYFTPATRRRTRTVTTIPDLQYIHVPETFSAKKRLWLGRAHRDTLRRADAVTVYSEFVRNDIESQYGGRHIGKVSVIPIPVSWERFDVAGDQPSAVSTARPFVLGVSSHYKHKNLSTLIKAFERLHHELPELQLVLVGQLGRNLIGVKQTEDVPALISSLGLDDCVVATGYINPGELGWLYRNAELFAFPSIFEGFGLPPVEALGFGLPVVTTKRASLPEVTRGLADLVDDPFDVGELAALMLQRLADGVRPSANDVADLRAFYAPERIGAQLYKLLTDMN